MDQSSLYTLVRQLETEILAALSYVDLHEMEPRLRDIITTLRVQIVDVRLDVRDYEYADIRAEQIKHGRNARSRLEELRRRLLMISEHGIFNAVDVVHISTRIDGLLDGLV